MITRKSISYKQFGAILVCCLCSGTLFYLQARLNVNYIFQENREVKFTDEIIEKEDDNKEPNSKVACKVPVLDVNASEIMSLLSVPPKVICKSSSRDWVELTGSTIKISSWVKNKYGEVECSFTDIMRESDLKQFRGQTTTSHTEYNLEASDVVHVQCTEKKYGLQWEKIMIGVRSDQDLLDRVSWSKVPDDSLKLNVLIMGFDSASHNMWKRMLPKTYNYAKKNLEGIALNGFNIVGDGTLEALLAMLSGKGELESPDTRKSTDGAHFCDVYDLIWKDFEKNGYVTAWSEDMPEIGTFTYRLKGFVNQPVDHYSKPYYLESHAHILKESKFCYGNLSRFQIFLSYVRNMYLIYKEKPKFIFVFHSEYSHQQIDWLSNADEDFYKMLEEFNHKGLFNDTLLVLMSDHGPRFAAFRNTLQGKLEERLPLVLLVFPTWFKKKYPEAYRNLQINADRLTTGFDLHETLKNVLHFEGSGLGNLENRGISLFKEIPASRSCLDAGIEPHWCVCLNSKTLPPTDSIVNQAAQFFVKFANSQTSKHRDLCQRLYLGKISWAAKLLPNKRLLKFKRNVDFNGFVADMTHDVQIVTEIYQIQLSLDPGNMMYEFSVHYNVKTKKFIISEKEISRINKYKQMTTCLETRENLRYLGKFCNCY